MAMVRNHNPDASVMTPAAEEARRARREYVRTKYRRSFDLLAAYDRGEVKGEVLRAHRHGRPAPAKRPA